MNFLSEVIRNTKHYVWYVGAFFSISLLILVLSQTDLSILQGVLDSISWPFFLIAIIVLLLEGYFTALRFKLFTPGNQSIKKCLEVTAWFIVSLIILPARLGEFAVILLLKKYLGQSTGSSIMNVLSQRLIDLIFLCAMLFIFLLAGNILTHNSYLYLIITVTIIVLLSSLYKLDILLGFIASLIYSNDQWIKKKIIRKIFRMILQARIWYRFHLDSMMISKAIFLSTCKWACNIGGLSLLFYSLHVPLSEIQLLLVATAYNFLAVIPLQTIGGFGINEAGLSGILIFFNLPIEFAASMSVIIRIVLIFIPFLFFLSVYSLYYFTNKKIHD